MMAAGLIDKLTNFIMPLEESADSRDKANVAIAHSKSSHLRVHNSISSSADIRMMVVMPTKNEDVREYSNYLLAGFSVVVNFENVELPVQQNMTDFLNGVSYVIGGTSERISESVLMFVPAQVAINKELYAYSIPTYVKNKDSLAFN